ncbi:MAG TPA: hypothetical protein VFQ54_03905, partial [Thermomicrobiales bacterium]|nr:hypothetical protein [Thermomicrobiales bacterium]
MKRIGEVMRDFPVPPRPAGASPNGAIRITPRETVNCAICNDAGYVRMNVPIGHPMFGKLVMCVCREKELSDRRMEDLHRLSNLDAFTHHTFEEFDPSLHGLEHAYEEALAFAQEPGQRWLFLYGPCGV